MFWRRRSAKDFAEEIEAHLELEADDLRAEGLSAEAARVKAKREFGNVLVAQERQQQLRRFFPVRYAQGLNDRDGWASAMTLYMV